MGSGEWGVGGVMNGEGGVDGSAATGLSDTLGSDSFTVFTPSTTNNLRTARLYRRFIASSFLPVMIQYLSRYS